MKNLSFLYAKSKMMTDSLFDTTTRHYLEVTMKNASRDRPPHKPQDWKNSRLCQNTPLYSSFTYNYFPFAIASSSLQAAIRQGNPLEACQWALEMIRTDSSLSNEQIQKRGLGISNVWSRLAIISCEDVGLANPLMCIVMTQILDKKYNNIDEEETAILNATILLARSFKTRLVDWSCVCRINPEVKFDNTEASLITYHDKIIENLKSGNHFHVIAYVEELVLQSLHDKEVKNKDPFPKTIFNTLAKGVSLTDSPVKYYKNKRQLIWLCCAKVIYSFIITHPAMSYKYLNVIKIVEACYNLSHSERFRWSSSARLFENMAVMAICLRDQIESRGLDLRLASVEQCFPSNKDLSQQDIQDFRTQHSNGTIWYGVSEISKDKHTREGTILGRKMQHFIELKAFVNFEDDAFKELNDFYLKLCILTRYNEGSTFNKSGLSPQQYSDWIVELRKRYDRMAKI